MFYNRGEVISDQFDPGLSTVIDVREREMEYLGEIPKQRAHRRASLNRTGHFCSAFYE